MAIWGRRSFLAAAAVLPALAARCGPAGVQESRSTAWAEPQHYGTAAGRRSFRNRWTDSGIHSFGHRDFPHFHRLRTNLDTRYSRCRPVHSQAAGGAALPAPEAAVHGGSRPHTLYPGGEEPCLGELGFQPGGLSDPRDLFRNPGMADSGERGRSLAGKNPRARAGPPGLAHLGPDRSQCCRPGSYLLRRALSDGLEAAHYRRPEGQGRPGTEWAPRVRTAVGPGNPGGRGLCLPGEPPPRPGA